MYVATIQHLNDNGQESKKHNLQFMFLTHVTLKRSQGHETYNENVDPVQDYNHAKFKRSCFKCLKKAAFLFQTKKCVNYLSQNCF